MAVHYNSIMMLFSLIHADSALQTPLYDGAPVTTEESMLATNQKQAVISGNITTARAHENPPPISQLISKKFLQT